MKEVIERHKDDIMLYTTAATVISPVAVNMARIPLAGTPPPEGLAAQYAIEGVIAAAFVGLVAEVLDRRWKVSPARRESSTPK